MRRLSLLALALIISMPATAARNDKNTLTNTRYQESPAEAAAREFKEADVALPAFPDTRSGNWFDLYISNTYRNQPKVLLDSVSLAPDGSVRYLLNIQSTQGHDNLTAEGIFCADTAFNYNDSSKRSSYKIFGYGDTVNKRWITPRSNLDWKPIGAILNSADPVRGVLFRAFCVDGKPATDEGLRERVVQRSGRYATTVTNTAK
ncbi:MAG: CNP1-like family protein [Neisseria sp.]|nr:CNP1-like family protein [Neisseria sp.]